LILLVTYCMSSLSPIEWVPGSFPIPFFQTWCCERSVGTHATEGEANATPWDDLKNAGLPPKMYECVVSNLIHNRVGVDCVYYLYNDADCRAFIRSAFPPAVVAAYDRLIPTAFKADLWRYCVLYKFGGVYLDVKYRWGVPQRDGSGDCDSVPTLREIVERWGGTAPQRRNFVRCVVPGVSPPNGGGGGRDGGGGGGGGGDDILCLERDAVDLWAPGRFGIHNAFIITKPKNPLFLECIFRIVSAAAAGTGGGGGVPPPNGGNFVRCVAPGVSPPNGGGGDFSAGWMTRPLFVTGPGLLGDVWRDVRWDARTTMAVPDSYATMAPYFRFFFEGNGIISYFIDPEDDGLDGKYIQILKVYDEYNQEVASGSGSGVPHYTVLWSRGIVWGVPRGYRHETAGTSFDRPEGAHAPHKTHPGVNAVRMDRRSSE